jgi:hypothetical protein
MSVLWVAARGLEPTDAEELLARHASGERLFCGAVLWGANLSEAALDHANLSVANWCKGYRGGQ